MKVLALALIVLKFIGIFLLFVLSVFLIIVCVSILSNMKLRLYFKINDEKKFLFTFKYLFGIIYYNFDGEHNIIKIFGVELEKYKKLKNCFKIKKNVKNINTTQQDEIINDEFNTKTCNEDTLNEKQEIKDENHQEKQNKFKSIFKILKNINEFENKSEIIKITLKFIKNLLNSVKFDKLKIDLEYGFSDPYKTGCLCGVISIIQPILHKNLAEQINLIPNFNESKILGEIDLKCKTSILKLLLPTLRFILKKPIRKLIFRKGD